MYVNMAKMFFLQEGLRVEYNLALEAYDLPDGQKQIPNFEQYLKNRAKMLPKEVE